MMIKEEMKSVRQTRLKADSVCDPVASHTCAMV